jgi:TonB-dependent SusC/RagA subfamily outer membrane receptor
VAAVCSIALFAIVSANACASATSTRAPEVKPQRVATDGDSLADSSATRHPSSFRQPGNTLEESDLRSQKATRVEELLVGRFPGVNVMRTPSGGISIQIRGQNSFLGNSEPLIVIDGMICPPGSNALDAINPYDIARIEVLRRISETAYYGVRGANGVILITTKR